MKTKKIFEKQWGENSISVHIPATLRGWVVLCFYVSAVLYMLSGSWDKANQTLILAILCEILECVRGD